jgi:TfoX/Sxy family transcriptional regulator of competence genes
MFGGYGLYHGGLIFGLIANDALISRLMAPILMNMRHEAVSLLLIQTREKK